MAGGARPVPWVHGALGVASFVPGLSVVTGAADAAIYAAEGEMVEAGLAVASMVPGGKVVTTAGKVVKGAATAMKGAGAAQDAGKAVKAAKNAGGASKGAKSGKEADDAARLSKAEEGAPGPKKTDEEAAATGGGNGKDGAKVKGRKKLKCGEYGKYQPLKKKTGDGKFHRDHIPSKAALIRRARELTGEKLTKKQLRDIANWGNSIAIPRQAHIDISPTYGQTKALAATDAKDLAGAARRDVEAMLKKIDEYDADGGCKKAYQKAAKRVLKDNKWFDEQLLVILKPARERK